jgi:hypothetical protein
MCRRVKDREVQTVGNSTYARVSRSPHPLSAVLQPVLPALAHVLPFRLEEAGGTVQMMAMRIRVRLTPIPFS